MEDLLRFSASGTDKEIVYGFIKKSMTNYKLRIAKKEIYS
jgi:hypothetical protein